MIALSLNDHQELERLKIQLRSLRPQVEGVLVASDECEKLKETTSFYNATCIDVPTTREGHWKRRRFHTHAALRQLSNHTKISKDTAASAAVVVTKSDILVYVDNLKQYLTKSLVQQKYEGDFYVGHVLEFQNTSHYFCYALTAYVLSWGFVDRYVALSPGACWDETHTEDDYGADYCLANDDNMQPRLARDEDGREYFLPFHVVDHHDRMTKWVDDWYYHNKDSRNVGEQCCAAHPISFGNYRNPRLLEHMYGRGMAPSMDELLELQRTFGKSS